FLWKQLSGSPATIDNINGAITKVSNLSQGTNEFELTVTDNVGATDTDTVTITVEPCGLPCEGEAEKCRYILWFQKPDVEHTITHQTKSASLTLTDEKGNSKSVDLVEIFREILDKQVITGQNFDAQFEALITSINKEIPPEFLGGDQPMFSYDKDNQLLFIEKYVCHKVVMDLNIELINLETTLHIVYDENGVTIENFANQQKMNVPKFGCFRINKCTGKSEEVCTGQLIVEDIIGQQEVFNQPFFKFLARPDFDRYYWYFHDGNPVNSDQKEAEHITISSNGDPLVRLLVISNNGCFGILEKRVKLEIIVG
ncbi:MAG TPA: hypothetical protein VH396_12960, partial [Chitinophagaceae bacterium]